jgi:SLOG-like protein
VTSTSKYRSRAIADSVIAFSVSYQRDNLLARGMGFEHLRELLLRLARPILRQGAGLAYGGNWEETEDNFMFPLLRLISAEQEDNSSGGPDSNLQIGKLYNHTAWPWYLDITPKIEAQWINVCRIVRITQQRAGLSPAEIVADADAKKMDARLNFNKVVTLSAMRRLMMQPMLFDIPDAPQPEKIPAVVASILLGGKADDYSGFLPGIFEKRWSRCSISALSTSLAASAVQRRFWRTPCWRREAIVPRN